MTELAGRLISFLLAACASPARPRRRAAAGRVAGCRAGARSERARPPVPAVQGQRRSHLKRNPLQALFRGDYRYADRLGDLFSDAHYQGEKAAAEHDLAALHAIPRGQLNADDQLAYDVFDYQTKDTLRGLQPDLLALTEARPMNHFFGLHTAYPTLASGQGGAPFKTRRRTMRTG